MTIEQFHESLSAAAPPAGATVYLSALWFAHNGDWDTAHGMIQDVPGTNAAWVHAYLHRFEGDIANADYWYRRAGKTRPSLSLNEEWSEIAKMLIGNN